MALAEAEPRGARGRRVLFIQATEPAGYPPLIHASMLMAEAGWEVAFLSAPIRGRPLRLSPHPNITVHAVPERPSHVMGKAAYVGYSAAAARLALRMRPDVVYASDPLGAGPGLLAARLSGAMLVYHEHDSPPPGGLNPWLARWRSAAARSARVVVFPNAARAEAAQSELGFSNDRLRIVWNMPRREELPALVPREDGPLLVYYHGGISPARLPETVADAVRRSGGRVKLRIAGREAPGAQGYLARLLDAGNSHNAATSVEYLGELPFRSELLARTATCDLGLALMPRDSMDINMRHMAGASNKPFDYMAAGLALLVSDLPDWHEMLVRPGYARGCDPADPGSVAAALGWFLDHPEKRRAMAARSRAKIEAEWNYDAAFAPVMAELVNG
ncbi:MAG TPA: glycosyltransferase [Stellaceae bacterium]|jgi:glycosyltransferase involved in cell wall biosynthesis|nr:glycosyltransferase [Stellaceae bacterium]